MKDAVDCSNALLYGSGPGESICLAPCLFSSISSSSQSPSLYPSIKVWKMGKVKRMGGELEERRHKLYKGEIILVG